MIVGNADGQGKVAVTKKNGAHEKRAIELTQYVHSRQLRMKGIWKPDKRALALFCTPWPLALVTKWMLRP